jgi:hypothetical protein
MAKKKTTTKSSDDKPTKKKAPAKKKAPPKPKTPKAQSRPEGVKGIEDLAWVRVGDLIEHEKNWKTHPERQLKMLAEDIGSGDNAGKGTVGWAGASLYNITTNKLLDGHGRKKLFEQDPDTIVPILRGQWTPEEELIVLRNLDPITSLYEVDTKALRELNDDIEEMRKGMEEELSEKQSQVLGEMNELMDQYADYIDAVPENSAIPDFEIYEDEEMTAEEFAQRDDTELIDPEKVSSNVSSAFTLKLYEEIGFDEWEGKTIYDIPLLRKDMLAPALPNMVTWAGPETREQYPDAENFFFVYGSAAIEKLATPNMIMNFYTQDKKFESIWNDPRTMAGRMLNMQIHACVTPNYSIFYGDHLAHDIWQTFRSRWIGRYYQEAGIKVIPDILLSNWKKPDPENPKKQIWDEERIALRLAGIPIGVPCIAVQLQQKGAGNAEALYALARSKFKELVRRIKPKQIIAYCPPDLPPKFFDAIKNDTEVFQVETFMTSRKPILDKKRELLPR